jgi:hypothetical protein
MGGIGFEKRVGTWVGGVSLNFLGMLMTVFFEHFTFSQASTRGFSLERTSADSPLSACITQKRPCCS